MTTLTLDLPPALSAKLRQEAEAEAKEVQDLVLELIEDNLTAEAPEPPVDRAQEACIAALRAILANEALSSKEVETQLLDVLRGLLRGDDEVSEEDFIRSDIEWGLRGDD